MSTSGDKMQLSSRVPKWLLLFHKCEGLTLKLCMGESVRLLSCPFSLYFCLCTLRAPGVICLCTGLCHRKKTECSFCSISCHHSVSTEVKSDSTPFWKQLHVNNSLPLVVVRLLSCCCHDIWNPHIPRPSLLGFSDLSWQISWILSVNISFWGSMEILWWVA